MNIPRYVDTFEEEELVDIDEVQQNKANIEAELAQVTGADEEVSERAGTIRRITWNVLKILSLMITPMCAYIC